MSSVRSVLFCAGRGTRLRPLTDTVPKAALPLGGTPLGAWGLAALAQIGGTVVNVGHLGTAVVDALRPFGSFDVLSESPEPYGTAGTLAALRDRITDRVVTYNGDLLTDLDIAELVSTHERRGSPATIAVVRVEVAADLQEDGERVTRFIDRRAKDVAGSRFIGVAVWERIALELLPAHRPAGLGESLLPALAERGELAVHVHHGYSLDVGTPERYLRAQQDVASGSAPAPPLARESEHD
jgi:mannose-1-phosphate guanylyltransferase